MKRIHYSLLEGRVGYYATLAILGAIAGAGLLAAWYMEHYGHVVTGMTNQIVWGTPHVFAVFLIVAASGVLNVASIGTVFERKPYKPLGRLSALMAVAVLAGGLMVLVLDLGRPDRLIVAMTKYNFKSIFAWNIYLYNGFFAVVLLYLYTQMSSKFQVRRYYKAAGTLAFVWRLILTTGTGSIFGWLVARQGYDLAIYAPMFIALSFSFGLALFLLVTIALYRSVERPLGHGLVNRMGRLLGVFVLAARLLGVFVLAAFYFVAVAHLTNLYLYLPVLGRLRARGNDHSFRPGLLALGPHQLQTGGDRLAADGHRRSVADLRDHHRRSGLSAGAVPGQGGVQLLLRRRDQSLRAELPGDRAGRGGLRHRHSDHGVRHPRPAADAGFAGG